MSNHEFPLHRVSAVTRYLAVSAFVVASLLAATASLSVAQSIRGSVAGSQGGVPGVVVELLDSTARVVTRALSNERGEFFLEASSAGSYVLRSLRIGFRPSVEHVELKQGERVSVRLTLSEVRIQLDTIRVTDRTKCERIAVSDPRTATLWHQARTALAATDATARRRGVTATTVVFERLLDVATKRVALERTSVRSQLVTQPWRAAAPEVLRQQGFVVRQRDNATVFHAPGIDFLLSDGFVEDYCFRFIDPGNSALVGIEFGPVPERRRIPSIRGVMWVDRGSAELKSLDFGYVNVSRDLSASALGHLTFAPLRQAGWVVTSWRIRMPLVEERIGSPQFTSVDNRLLELREEGGELSLAVMGSDTLWASTPLVLTASLVDSLTLQPVSSARVAVLGTTVVGESDLRGRVHLQGLLPGYYSAEIKTESLDSVNAAHRVYFTLTTGADSVTWRIPGAIQFARGYCSSTSASREYGLVAGSLRVVADSFPLFGGGRVLAEWPAPSANIEPDSSRLVRASVSPDSDGRFRICVPVNTPIRVHHHGEEARAVEIRLTAKSPIAQATLYSDRSSFQAAGMVGNVVADPRQTPLAGAEITIPSLSRTLVTDESGRFSFSTMGGGRYRVLVRKIGFAPYDAEVSLEAGTVLERTIVLTRVVSLDSVVVTATPLDRLRRSFEDHKRIGLGRFLTRADFDRADGQPITSVLGQLPGIQIIRGRGSSAWIASRRGPRTLTGELPSGDAGDRSMGAVAACYAHVYLNSTLIYRGKVGEPLYNVGALAPGDIDALEYYASPAQTPAMYRNLDSVCGVVVIWTR